MSAVASFFGAAWLTAALLVAVRLGALLLATPILYAVPMPTTARVALTLSLASALALPLASAAGTPASSPDGLMAAVLGEAVIGATLGLGVLMAFAGIALAGRLLDVQIGFGIGQVFDPVTQTQLPVLTSIFGIAGLVLFLLIDGHHALLRGVALSLERFPPGTPWNLHAGMLPIVRGASALFALGFALAAPVVMCVFLIDVTLGVVARNLPQINMMVLGIPLKIVAGLLALSVWATGMGGAAVRIYTQMFDTWSAIFLSQPDRPAGRTGTR
jgi:flagellar biosynthetic protein FliR